MRRLPAALAISLTYTACSGPDSELPPAYRGVAVPEARLRSPEAIARGRVRFNLADTDSTAYVFEDAEIDQMLTDSGTVDGATAACLRVLPASSTSTTPSTLVQSTLASEKLGMGGPSRMM